MARKIGKEKYLYHLKRLDYGNHRVGYDVTTFWLEEGNGELKITPFEQMNFLQRLYRKELPISERTYTILQDIMLEEDTPDYKLYSKTGAATQGWVGHGWYVGYIIKKDKAWFFVTNILINETEDLPKRKQITMAVLRTCRHSAHQQMNSSKVNER